MSVIPRDESILILDIGSRYTKAILFDVVEGRYRFIGKGVSATTAAAPSNDVSTGIYRALDHLQAITTRKFLDASRQLIVPSLPDGSGIDSFAACISVGKPFDVVVVGLMDYLSGESALRLAKTTYAGIKTLLSLNDGRSTEERLNVLAQSRPDLIIAAGGTDAGASQAAIKLLETVGLACYLIPENHRPVILFAGNQAIVQNLQTSVDQIVDFVSAPNIRPSAEIENLDPAKSVLGDLCIQKKIKQITGLELVQTWAGKAVIPSATGFGRIVSFLSAVLKEKKGVLGIDLGASAAVVAAAVQGELTLDIFPELGLNAEAPALLGQLDLREIEKWLPQSCSLKQIQEYVYDRWLYPGTLPCSQAEWDLEGAITRQILFHAKKKAEPDFKHLFQDGNTRNLVFEPILLSGSLFSNSNDQKRNTLIALDGLQPEGITTLIIDQHQIAPALGAAAGLNSLLTVQVLDTNAFSNLGTIIAPVFHVKTGQRVLRYKMVLENGLVLEDEVKSGSLQTVPLPYGESAQLFLQPYYGADVGMGAAGRGGKLIVKGGLFGVIIDARGRPLHLPEDPTKRMEILASWEENFGIL